MASKAGLPQLPEGLPNPEAIFDSWWPIIIALVGGLIFGIRQYFRGARCTSVLKLDKKVAIVTGGNTGIGRYIAEDFAKRGAKVYLACRNETAGEETAAELRTKTKNDNIRCMKCDLKSFKSIKSFVDAFKKKEEHLHYLINNAGVMMCPKNLTEDKFEEQFQVNYLGHFLLTHLLYSTLKQSSPARIINTTAAAYQLGEIDFEDISSEEKEYSAAKSYSQSKLAVTLFTVEFAKRFPVEDCGLSVYCVNPGVVRTNIHRHMPFKQSFFVSFTFAPFIWFLMKHSEDGAQTTIFCSLAEALKTVSGKYYKECKREPFDAITENEDLQKKLWGKSLEWLDIKEFGKTD